ncbi:hypothetical protein FVEG_11566 [Fusarium verticillioides 7600]|uniref:Uncharacterized protein n=1 Tax=Gibberella moniliformis (strain M3125 / FGSC 7600) TaxID=334819 RepID=W7MZ31_GIBM7|nr:hypothetical protein FVEG_11566 [Fusarium verticillioides 7600]EWG53055.1 hypothetical protein FVEG_11566 [Fusarium verticillioides 7600]
MSTSIQQELFGDLCHPRLGSRSTQKAPSEASLAPVLVLVPKSYGSFTQVCSFAFTFAFAFVGLSKLAGI